MTGIQLRGIIDEILYEDTYGRAVFRLISGSETVRAIGKVGKVYSGETWFITGDWEIHQQHGRQLKVASGYPVSPDTTDEMIALFSGDKFDGVGLATASRLVRRYGNELWSILEEEPSKLLEDGILTKNKAQLIIQAFEGIKHQWEVMHFLVEHRLPFRLAEPLITIYDSEVIFRLKENPYRLLPFVSWDKVDQVAMELGAKHDDDNRLKAAIIHVLQQHLTQGNTAVQKEVLLQQVYSLLTVPKESLEPFLVEPFVISVKEELYQLPGIASQERTISKVFSSLASNPSPLAEEKWVESWLNKYETEHEIKLDFAQRDTVYCAIQNRIMVLTGGPGSGKTSVIDAIRSILQDLGQPVILSAPTGRAAKKLQESSGMEAKTLHRFFGYSQMNFSFPKNENGITNLIIDESSMVDLRMWSAITRSISYNSRLILVGDINQLPPVGTGQVFYDIVTNASVPVIQLTKIHRQASDNPIPYVSRDIKDGLLPSLPPWNKETKGVYLIEETNECKGAEKAVSLAVQELETAGIPIDEVQILSPRKNGKSGTRNINEQVRKKLGFKDISASIPFSLGDRVIQTKNNYNLGDNGVMNGSVGIVVDCKTDSVTVDFDGEEIIIPGHAISDLEHAYSISVHKSQGSQYRTVIIPLYSSSRRLLTRQLIYTALSRATDLVIIVGTKEVLQKSIKNSSTSGRVTGLPYYLNEQ